MDGLDNNLKTGLKNGVRSICYREIFGNIDVTPYRIAAERFLPDKIEVLFIFESPPFPPPTDPITGVKNSEWSYFYRFETTGSNFLRNKLSIALFNRKMSNAKLFLEDFKKYGYFLIDAVNYPINKIAENKGKIKLTNKGKVHSKERQNIVYSEVQTLIDNINYWADKSRFTNIKDVKILIIKVPVFNGLILCENPFKSLVDNGSYRVLNNFPIPFPMPPHDITFIREVRKLLNINF